MHVTVVIPTYNEAKNIGEIIGRIRATAPEVNILVADDNSPDGTGRIVEGIATKDSRVRLYRRAGKEGLGAAYIAAFKRVLADGGTDLVIMMDADFSHDPKYLPRMLELAQSHDVVLGSRYVRGGATVGWELWRRALSYFGNLYAHLVAGVPLRDFTGGFNAIRVETLRKINFDAMNVSGYAFIMGLKLLLFQSGANFAEFPIVFHNRKEGESKMSSASITRYFNEGILAPWKMRFNLK